MAVVKKRGWEIITKQPGARQIKSLARFIMYSKVIRVLFLSPTRGRDKTYFLIHTIFISHGTETRPGFVWQVCLF